MPRLGSLVYPTVLNALIRMNDDRSRQVIVPRYAGYQEDVQNAARKIIEGAFPGATIDEVEAMHAAGKQGAVHCLTLVAPLADSVFRDGWTEMNRTMQAIVATGDYKGVWQVEDGKGSLRFYIYDGQIKLMSGEKTIKTWETDATKKVGSKYVTALRGVDGELWLDLTNDAGTIEMRRNGARVSVFRVKRWVPTSK